MLRMCTKLDLMVYALFGAAEIKQDGDQVIIDDWVVLFGRECYLRGIDSANVPSKKRKNLNLCANSK